ncbi:LEM-3-like GIY-YIG domain-containing protein [Salinibacter grassmerensis]|uniref:LEM-3-like GIY-YIG domain-containing protein n=1 Tax=Salinibacter grassmerensis TaxID=3040353 RepID=UPI0021E6E220|nr:NUMOD3 domain-containing DNA-binding protein [Salinibacter grassmerensis]
MNKHRFYVYGLFYEDDDGNNVCFYIGKGTGYRHENHFYSSTTGDNPYKDNKIAKLQRQGYEPFSKIIKGGLTEEKAYALEEAILQRDDVYENLTNMTRGGKGVKAGEDHPSKREEVRKKMSEAHKGKTFSEETRRKLSKALSGRTHSEDSKRKMSKNTNTKGEENPDSTLTKEEAATVKWLARNSNMTQKEIASSYGIDQTNVSLIKRDKSWQHVDPKPPVKES